MTLLLFLLLAYSMVQRTLFGIAAVCVHLALADQILEIHNFPYNYNMSFPLLNQLKEEVKTLDTSPTLSTLFTKYLKEPRFQSPLTIQELSNLFQYFYRDLHALTVHSFTGSQSTKKQLISNSRLFSDHPKIFDYLLAIANYSASSIKLLKRDDNDALYQLRVFNYYKFLVILETLEREQLRLFNSSTSDENTLYDKIFRFDQKDIIYQEFLEEKLSLLLQSGLGFENFIEGKNDRLVSFIEGLTKKELEPINFNLVSLRDVDITPLSKLRTIVKIHKNLMKLFVANGFKGAELNNDVILPSLIYLIIFKLEYKSDLYLNFVFIKNFIYFLDPYKVELYHINMNSTYTPSDRPPRSLANKYRLGNFFEVLNLNESQIASEEVEFTLDFEFFDNDNDLIQHILATYLNNGELNFYLTNFEAIVSYLSNVTSAELGFESSNKLLNVPISVLVVEELETHFQLPDGMLSEEMEQKETAANAARSRSNSLMNVISTKLNETRSRSSSMKNKESFPTLDNPETDTLSIMRNILGRLGSVLALRSAEDETEEANIPRRQSSFINRMSPNHTRTRSSSLENGKRNSMTGSGSISKFTSGVSDFMGKLSAAGANTVYTGASSVGANFGLMADADANSSTGSTLVDTLNGTNESANANTTTSTNGNITTSTNGNITTSTNGNITTSTNGSTATITSNGNSISISNGSTAANGSTAEGSNIAVAPVELEKNVSTSSLQTLETGTSTEIVETPSHRRPDYTRSRTTSLQIMDKWFNNISLNPTQASPKHKHKNSSLGTNIEVRTVEELTSFANVDFDLMLVKDLRMMKSYYDLMCAELKYKEEEDEESL